LSTAEKEYEFSKGKTIYIVGVDNKEEPDLVKTMNGTILNIAMLRSIMKKGVNFLSLDAKGESVKVEPAGMTSVSGLKNMPEFDI
jgi:Ni,Fe-hydrogenase III large subunit